MQSFDLVLMFLAFGTLLGMARFLGELFRHFNQPAVLGEILAGLFLGPTLLGRVWPEAHGLLFPEAGPGAIVLQAFATLAITLYLLVAGMEVDLSTLWRQGRLAIMISLSGILLPFAAGFLAAWFFPLFLGAGHQAQSLAFPLFFATALSISSLPIIAKTLMDIDLYRTDLGMVIMAAAIGNDLVGWIIFAAILGMIGQESTHGASIGEVTVLVLGTAIFMLTLGRWLINRLLGLVQTYASWSGGVISLALTLTLFSAAWTEWIGVHALFGAFLFGIALGDSSRVRKHTRVTLEQFISFFFAPFFFAGIGLHLDFWQHFDPLLTLVVVIISIFGKVVGCGLGGKLAGLPWNQAWAIGFGMNARGAMEIILALLAFEAGLIGANLFMALVVMALVTTAISGPGMQFMLGHKKNRLTFTDFLSAKTFVPKMQVNDCWEAIELLSRVAALQAGLDPLEVIEAVKSREETMSTGVAKGLALPHGRLPKLKKPIIALGICSQGVDFHSVDNTPAYLIILILNGSQDSGVQLRLLADAARIIKEVENLEEVKNITEFSELLHWLRIQRNKAGVPKLGPTNPQQA